MQAPLAPSLHSLGQREVELLEQPLGWLQADLRRQPVVRHGPPAAGPAADCAAICAAFTRHQRMSRRGVMMRRVRLAAGGLQLRGRRGRRLLVVASPCLLLRLLPPPLLLLPLLGLLLVLLLLLLLLLSKMLLLLLLLLLLCKM